MLLENRLFGRRYFASQQLVVAGSSDDEVIGAEGDTFDELLFGARRRINRPDLFARRHIPDTDGLVPPARCQQGAIRTKGDGPNLVRVAFERRLQLRWLGAQGKIAGKRQD